ncbi:MAG: Rieske 2Fe-2S domain-containing protein [Actinophytocola sp.]|nr:Rieske 2Fe-2S domain-containing protein [Actinophytocola sp.]
MGRTVVARASEIPPGGCRLILVNGEGIGVFNVAGNFYAVRNACPHQGGPLCLGEVTGTTQSDDPAEVRWVRAGEIVRCPWHNWEFDILTGRALFNPNRRVKTYPVTLEAEQGEDGSRPSDGDALVVVVEA